jgi:hypothetical protein
MATAVLGDITLLQAQLLDAHRTICKLRDELDAAKAIHIPPNATVVVYAGCPLPEVIEDGVRVVLQSERRQRLQVSREQG